ncbi:tRNA (cytosine-5-)-methyltransferase [Borealophlyctis nickersoniae]|nr:tRNA (cytosine-5-)-methyltransferase [Borealophlyctis nickersoniae]
MEPVRAIEFFSGIGGLHYGLEYADPDATVVAAFDINMNANLWYLSSSFSYLPTQFRYQTVPNLHTILDSSVSEQIECKLLVIVSSVSAVYTRFDVGKGGKSLDDKDPRAEGLLHLIELLGMVERPPRYLFLENVPNFEVSRSRAQLVQTLDELGYTISEFLVTPLQYGIPNDRRRYYLTVRPPVPFAFTVILGKRNFTPSRLGKLRPRNAWA